MEITVGIDVSKKRLDVYVHPSGAVFSVGNEPAGLAELVARLGPIAPHCIGLEATGGYERLAAASLAEAGLPVVVLNPAQVRSFAKAMGARAKTDAIDARMIALFVAATQPEPRALADTQSLALAELMARRRQLVGMLVAEKNRQGRLPPGKVRLSVVRIIAALTAELATLDTDLGQMIEQSPVCRDKQDLLASVPGIGDTIARALLADLPELGQLDRRAIAALAGLAPFIRQSGQWRGKSFFSGGRAAPRAACSWAPWSQRATTPRSRASTNACWPPANPSASPSSPPPESCSLSSTPSSGIKNHGKTLDCQDSRSTLHPLHKGGR